MASVLQLTTSLRNLLQSIHNTEALYLDHDGTFLTLGNAGIV